MPNGGLTCGRSVSLLLHLHHSFSQETFGGRREGGGEGTPFSGDPSPDETQELHRQVQIPRGSSRPLSATQTSLQWQFAKVGFCTGPNCLDKRELMKSPGRKPAVTAVPRLAAIRNIAPDAPRGQGHQAAHNGQGCLLAQSGALLPHLPILPAQSHSAFSGPGTLPCVEHTAI